jgi:hypothetical protein
MSKKVSELPQELVALDPTDLLLITKGTESKSVSYKILSQSQAVSVVGSNIDWDLSDMFHDTVTANTTYTFTNSTQNKSVVVVVHNTSGSTVTIDFPAGIYKEAGTLTIDPGLAAVYTFISVNSNIYFAAVSNLSN